MSLHPTFMKYYNLSGKKCDLSPDFFRQVINTMLADVYLKCTR